MKEGAIIHLVLESSISFAPPQAAGLIHSAARPLPTRSYDLVGTPCVIAFMRRKKGVISIDTLYLDLPCKSQGFALRRSGYPVMG